MFLAESHRYREVNDSRADEYYQEALDMFQKAQTPDDDWNVPWTFWHIGDLCLERGQGEKTLQMCRESMKLAMEASDVRKEWDNEVIANCFRLRADVCWQRRDITEAFGNYARAVFYAYIFHGCPNPPDFYTLDFYREMLQRTLERIFTLWKEEQKVEALQACQILHDFWRPYWKEVGKTAVSPPIETLLAENRQQELAAYLFPPAPTETEVACQAPEYVKTVNKMLEEFAERLKDD
jgi:hypothetical protein